MSAGKGDTPRPVDPKKYGENYDRIFRGKSINPKTDWHQPAAFQPEEVKKFLKRHVEKRSAK